MKGAYLPGDRKRTVVLNYIVAFKQEHDGRSPSIREIATNCDIKSPSVVTFHVKKLVEAGLLRMENGYLQVPGGKWIPPRWFQPEQGSGEGV